jgi:hypothetical protein
MAEVHQMERFQGTISKSNLTLDSLTIHSDIFQLLSIPQNKKYSNFKGYIYIPAYSDGVDYGGADSIANLNKDDTGHVTVYTTTADRYWTETLVNTACASLPCTVEVQYFGDLVVQGLLDTLKADSAHDSSWVDAYWLPGAGSKVGALQLEQFYFDVYAADTAVSGDSADLLNIRYDILFWEDK